MPSSMPKQTQTVTSKTSIPNDERNLTLRKSDYDKIQKFYKKVLESQGELDQSLSNYRKELEALGEVLQETPITLHSVKPLGE